MQITISGGDLLSFIIEGVLTKEEVKQIILVQYPIFDKKSE